MREEDYTTMDANDQDSSAQYSPPWIFQHDKLFDELGIQKLCDQSKLINKLNHINFSWTKNS